MKRIFSDYITKIAIDRPNSTSKTEEPVKY